MAQKTNNIVDKLQEQKTAIYIRVSTHWQIDKDSLQVQRRELIAYSEMVLGIKDYVVFEDPGYSAKNTDRPAYQQMMSRLRTGEFSHLLVWKIDRISRNLLDFTTMYQELKQLGIVFVSKNEQFDTSNAIGEAMLKIILVFAELERNMTAERVTAVMLSRANNGQWNGGRVPFGYSWDKEHQSFSIIEKESRIVQKIYNLYEQNQSLLYVVRYLNNAKITTRNGKEWSATTVHTILTSSFYIGTYTYNMRKGGNRLDVKNESEWISIPNHHEPIITVEQFERIQLSLQRNKRGGYNRGESRISKNSHIFAGLVKCGLCGSNMSATLDRRRADGWRPSIYGCSKRRQNTSECLNKFISDITLGPFIFNYIANIIRARQNIENIHSKKALEKKLLCGEAFSDIKEIESEGLEMLYNMLLNGSTGLEYKPASVFNESGVQISERSILEERRRKNSIALNRLRALYLYGDEETPEKDFIIERTKLTNEINEIDSKLEELRKEESAAEIDDEFLEKASYFIMVQNLLSDKYIDYEKYIRNIDQSIPTNFINRIISAIYVENGKIMSIKFRNGMTHKFIY